MEDLFRLSMRQDLLEEFNRSYDKGLPQEDIDRNIRYLKRQLEEKYGIPFSKAAGGEIFKIWRSLIVVTIRVCHKRTLTGIFVI